MVRAGVVRLQVKTELFARIQDLGKSRELRHRRQRKAAKRFEKITCTLYWYVRWGLTADKPANYYILGSSISDGCLCTTWKNTARKTTLTCMPPRTTLQKNHTNLMATL